MKYIASAAVAIFISVFGLARSGNAQNLEPFAKTEVSIGAEKETGHAAGARGTFKLLGTYPLMGSIGIQAGTHLVTGRGARIGLNGGPVLSWGQTSLLFPGKAGFFVAYQHRGQGSGNFVWLRPAMALYFDRANVNLWYSHPVSSGNSLGGGKKEFASNRAQGTVSYFLPMDLWAPFMAKDNVELILGLQVNSFAGAGSGTLGTGVGPVLGVSFMPMRNLAVNVLRATWDSQSRYKVNTGLEYAFWTTKPITTLKELRRKYLQPNDNSEDGAGTKRRRGGSGS